MPGSIAIIGEFDPDFHRMPRPIPLSITRVPRSEFH
jgi:hypothetical protein